MKKDIEQLKEKALKEFDRLAERFYESPHIADGYTPQWLVDAKKGKSFLLSKLSELEQAMREETIEILKEVKDKLEEYAEEDERANGNGYGCFSDGFKFIKPTIDKIDNFIKSVK